MTVANVAPEKKGGWLDRLLAHGLRIDSEALIYLVLILIALVTRFYDLESRVMSHDESLHTYYSWQLAQGNGYQHTPMMHGPLQFHLLALTYFLFGDSDATARVPAAAAGVLAVGMIALFRKWLGRKGALVASALVVVSPYLLYYARYTRNEAFVVVETLLTAYTLFRYSETRRARWLYLFALSLSLHLMTKETFFIFICQVMLFLAGYLTWQLLRRTWPHTGLKALFGGGMVLAVAGAGAGVVGLFRERTGQLGSSTEVLSPLDPAQAIGVGASGASPLVVVGVVVAAAGVLLVAVSLVLGFRERLRTDFPALDLLVVAGTMVLPTLSSIPAKVIGWDPLAYEDPTTYYRTLVVILVLALLATVVGLLWDWRRWLIIAGVFYGPFVVLQTTIFTNPSGLATGLVGSLGYWLVQHGVERGSQPWYYYLAVQLPVYEFLPSIGGLAALAYGLRRASSRPSSLAQQNNEVATDDAPSGSFPHLAFIAFWAISSMAAYSFAGERMPWLTVHITLPLILLTGWAIGVLLESIDWRDWWQNKVWLVAPLLALAMLAVIRAVGYGLGSPPPFQGSELNQLIVTSGFLIALVVGVGCLMAMLRLARNWSGVSLMKLTAVLSLTVLYVLTARAGFRASYTNGDSAKEFLVYAHGAPGVKTVLRQVEELSQRTTDGMAIDVGYDDDVSWPVTWYMRRFTNSHFYGNTPRRELLQYPLVIAGDSNWGKVEPILGDRYYRFEYIRMWWPMQDYWNLTWQRISEMLRTPAYRNALWEIWFNRDYTAYGEVTGRDFSEERWSPADRMRFYVRKDIAALIWDYGVAAEIVQPPEEDVYAGRLVELGADGVVGETGSLAGQLFKPRGLAVAADGSLYIADTGNNRIQHLAADGTVLHSWGSKSTGAPSEAAPGTLTEPWGVAVAPDGTVYVADTWNHRVQHFTADGQFLNAFGYYGMGETLEAFWGPRGVVVDDQGRVFVADTGNKRVVIFDAQGNPLGQFGGVGVALGQLDEPVGLGTDGQGRVYVADTWNMRIQVFAELSDLQFAAIAEWPIQGWYGQSLENKPYLAVAPSGHVCTTDPEGLLVLCFTSEGEFVKGWGDLGEGMVTFGITSGLAFDQLGGLWVVDNGHDRILHFTPGLQ